MARTDFSADKAAFFVFEKREKKKLGALGVLYVLTRFVLIGAVIALATPLIMPSIPGLMDMDTQSTEFTLKIQSLSNIFSGINLLFSLLFLPVFIAIYTALLRWMLGDESKGGLFGLHFGETELNVLVVMIALGLLIAFGALFSLIPLAVVLGIAAALMDDPNKGLLVTVGIVYVVIWLCTLIWVSVRLSPAAALTVKRGKIQVFETFAVTKGYFWSLFAAYLLRFFVLLAIGLVIFLAMLLIAIPFLLIGISMFGTEPSMSHVAGYVSLAAVPVALYLMMGFGMEYLGYAMGAGIAARMVMSLPDEKAETPAPPPTGKEKEETGTEAKSPDDTKSDAKEEDKPEDPPAS